MPITPEYAEAAKLEYEIAALSQEIFDAYGDDRKLDALQQRLSALQKELAKLRSVVLQAA